MSMICSVLGLSPSQIAALKANPALASYLAIRCCNHLLDDRQFWTKKTSNSNTYGRTNIWHWTDFATKPGTIVRFCPKNLD